MWVGDTLRIRVRFKDGKPGESALIKITGGTNTSNSEEFNVTGSQAFTYEPSVDFLLKATQEGSPSITVSSPENRFEPVMVNGKGFLGFLVASQPPQPPPQREALDEKENSTMSTTMIQPPPPPPQPSPPPKADWHFFLGTMTFILILCVAIGAAVLAQRVSDESKAVLVADEAEVDPVGTAEPEPAAPAAEPDASLPAPVAAADPTNCTFLNGNRPQVGEKYILRCDEGEYLATGTYVTDHFVWSDFEEHPEPK
ncbi:hypothetical protein HY733_01175 [Candidatus Uhrbacteria bacterium]|nr:hypothetical protein [Candidatus Uhrbacteria bacterium]